MKKNVEYVTIHFKIDLAISVLLSVLRNHLGENYGFKDNGRIDARRKREIAI